MPSAQTPDLSHKQAQITAPEYAVYVYHDLEDREENQTDWEMKRVTYSQIRALKLAQKYHDTESYQRVEIKKKYFDEKYGCMIDKTMKVFESGQPPSLGQKFLSWLK